MPWGEAALKRGVAIHLLHVGRMTTPTGLIELLMPCARKAVNDVEASRCGLLCLARKDEQSQWLPETWGRDTRDAGSGRQRRFSRTTNDADIGPALQQLLHDPNRAGLGPASSLHEVLDDDGDSHDACEGSETRYVMAMRCSIGVVGGEGA